MKAAMLRSGQRFSTQTDDYSLLGKIEFATAQYARAADSLERAMLRDIDSADRMFNIEGVEPEKTSKFCAWNLTDLDTLISKFPRDYRPLLFHGLYYKFFTTFKEDYYTRALQDFQKAALLNPTSPLPHYFIGDLYTKAAFWTKKAWASDTGRDEPTRNSIQAYTKAIQIDPPHSNQVAVARQRVRPDHAEMMFAIGAHERIVAWHWRTPASWIEVQVGDAGTAVYFFSLPCAILSHIQISYLC